METKLRMIYDFLLFLIKSIWDIGERLDTITNQQRITMATLAELTANVAALKTETASALSRVQVDVEKLKADVAAGSGVKESDLDAISNDIKAVVDSLKAVDPLPEFPPVEPTV